MNSRMDDPQACFVKYCVPLVLGTMANIFSTYLTLPLQYIFTQKQLHPQNPYIYLVRDTFSFSGLKNVYQQSANALKMAPKQSVAYLGVSMTAFTIFQQDEPLVRGIKAGLLSATAESIVTARDLQKIISGWNHADIHGVDKRTIYFRSLQATLMKNVLANPITLAFYLYAYEQLKAKTGSTSPIVSALAGMISAMLAAPIIAPLSTVQTCVQNNPSLTPLQHAKKIANQSYALFWKGGAARGVYKITEGMMKFGLVGVGQRMIDPYIAADARQAKHQ